METILIKVESSTDYSFSNENGYPQDSQKPQDNSSSHKPTSFHTIDNESQSLETCLGKERVGNSGLWFTCGMTLCLIAVFCMMCLDFRYYAASHGLMIISADTGKSGPSSIIDWIRKSDSWYVLDVPAWCFNADFLIEWGARSLPSMSNFSQLHRWFSSALLHKDFNHLFANLVIFTVLSCSLERRHGWWRVAFVFVVSHFCGALASAMLEDANAVVLGASGGVYGLTIFYVIDSISRFRIDKYQLVRLIAVILGSIYLFVNLATVDNGTSRLSHLGGVLFGIYPSLICALPINTALKFRLTITGAALVTMYIGVALFYIYRVMLANL